MVVRAYGARLRGGPKAEEVATAIFLKQNRLWNNLVEIEQKARADYQAALADSDAELGALVAQEKIQEEALLSLIEARNRDRSVHRAKKTSAADTFKLGIQNAKAALTTTRAAMKEARQRAKPGKEHDNVRRVSVPCPLGLLTEQLVDRVRDHRTQLTPDGGICQKTSGVA